MRKSKVWIGIMAFAVLVMHSGSIAGPRANKPSETASSAQGGKATVKMVSFKFEPATITVAPGTTVEWVNEGGRHTVESDDGKTFKSDVITAGGRFEFKFDNPGTYAYHCGLHGAKGGKDMAGKVIVKKGGKK